MYKIIHYKFPYSIDYQHINLNLQYITLILGEVKIHVDFAAFCDGKEFNKFIKKHKNKENSYI